VDLGVDDADDEADNHDVVVAAGHCEAALDCSRPSESQQKEGGIEVSRC